LHATYPSSDRAESAAVFADDGPFLEPDAPAPVRRGWRWHWLILLALTAIAGVSRFYALNHPPIWVDEASTFRRVSGTYEQMLQTMERDPFGPLFYELEWLVRQSHHLTPFWLRFIPALAGTLMVPAMYFLARQVAGIRTALVAATFTLCSAWMINYSRDAKMYMMLWLLTTLSAACFLWWVRSRTVIGWLSWIAASAAMLGTDLRTALLVAVMPVWMLTARRVHWLMGLGLVVGLVVMFTGPVGYYQFFNHWRDKVEDSGNFPDVSWVSNRNRGAGGLDLTQDSASAFLYSFTFLQESDGHPVPPRRVLLQSVTVFTTLVGLLAIGALPWRRWDVRRRRRLAKKHPASHEPVPATSTDDSWPSDAASHDLLSMSDDTAADGAGARAATTSPEVWWRPTLWLGLWMIVPTYRYYCLSVKGAESPADWLAGARAYLGYHAWIFAVLIAVLTVLAIRFRRSATVALAAVVAVALLLLGGAFRSINTGVPAEVETWRRPIDAINLWLAYLLDWRFLWPAIIVIAAVAIARSGRTYRQRFGQIFVTVLIVAFVGFALQQVHGACTDALAKMKDNGVRQSSIWVPRYLGFIWPAVAIATAALLLRLPTFPLRWLAIIGLCGVNLYVAHHRVLGHTEPPIDRIVDDVYAGDEPGATVKTFIHRGNVGGGPGGGSVWNIIGTYYFLNDRDDVSPDQVSHASRRHRRFFQRDETPPINTYQNPGMIAAMAKTNPSLDRLIVWDPIFRDRATAADQNIIPPPPDGHDDIARKLGPTWTRASYEIMPVCYHWSWSELYLYRRREYVRPPAPETPKPDAHSTTRPTH
jgi:hypothetical protein